MTQGPPASEPLGSIKRANLKGILRHEGFSDRRHSCYHYPWPFSMNEKQMLITIGIQRIVNFLGLEQQ